MMMMMTTSMMPSLKLPILKSSVRCSVSVAPPRLHTKPSAAEVSRTIMELSSVGTLSLCSEDEDSWPLGVGVRFAVDPEGTPIVCVNRRHLGGDKIRSSLNVQLNQSGGLRTTQCSIQGTINVHTRPPSFHQIWEKRFGEKAEEEIHTLDVERVLQMDNFMEDGVWVSCSEYKLATADPLRDFAERLVREINTHNMEDVIRFCNVYVDSSDIQVLQAKMVWVDRLGFDIHIYCSENQVYEVRIPFPREVTDEKSAKSSFNGMSQLAWEVEKNYHPLEEFHKVKQLKKIAAPTPALFL